MSHKKSKPVQTPTTSYNFERPIMIHICKDGTVSYRTKGQKVFNGVALPVFSVNTIEEAQRIQVRFCRLQYGSHPQMKPGMQWYRLTTFSGELDDLDRVSAEFAEFYANHIDPKTRERGRNSAAKQRYAIVDKSKRRRAGVE